MAFFEKLGKKIGDAAEAASDKAKDFAEITKLNNSISAAKKEIDLQLHEIGKWAFEEHKMNSDSPIALQCEKILENRKNIELYKAKIEEIKSGPELSEDPVVPAERFCGNCGAKVSEESKFCPECGNTLE